MTCRLRSALVLASLAALIGAGEAYAQSPTPTVDCSLLTPQQAQGLPCAVPRPTVAPPLVPDTPTQFDPDCADVNPYSNPEKAAECSARPLPGASTPRFLVGHRYAFGYMQLEAVILGIAPDLDGVQVITYRWLPASGLDGQVGAQRTPPSPGGRTPWTYLGR